MSSLASGYSFGSAIERLICRFSRRNGTFNLQAKDSAKASSGLDSIAQKYDGLVINETAKVPGRRDSSIEAGEGIDSSVNDRRYNEAHDWPLAKRIFVAGIICLYT